MIIDSHVHLVGNGWVRRKFLTSTSKAMSIRYNRTHNTKLTPGEYLDKVARSYIDPDGDRMVQTMDRVGVDTAVIFNVDWATLTGESRVTNKEINKHFGKTAIRHAGRFWPLLAIDPRRPDAIEQAQLGVEKWGMKGFKLMPSVGFYPDDPSIWPFYEKVREWGLPIMFHSGGWEIGWQYAQPMYIASVGEMFPEIPMIMAHTGLESEAQALLAASIMPNIFLDLSLTGQWNYFLNREKTFEWLRHLMDEATASKLLFATDWPGPNNWTPIDDWIDAFKHPKTNVKFSKEEMEMVLGRNAQELFKIPDDFRKNPKMTNIDGLKEE
jgi:predicted TIM-barrel fold metal-dependent hydrolase